MADCCIARNAILLILHIGLQYIHQNTLWWTISITESNNIVMKDVIVMESISTNGDGGTLYLRNADTG